MKREKSSERQFHFELPTRQGPHQKLGPTIESKSPSIRFAFPAPTNGWPYSTRYNHGLLASGASHSLREIVCRRFAAGLANFKALYCHEVDDWFLYDTSGDDWTNVDQGGKP